MKPCLGIPIKSRYDNDEYVRLYLENKAVVTEQRYLMTQFMGRELKASEVVHHIDGNKKHNVIDNFALLDRKDHPHKHASGETQVTLICTFCGKPFQRKIRNFNHKSLLGQKDFYCNRICMASHFGNSRPKNYE